MLNTLKTKERNTVSLGTHLSTRNNIFILDIFTLYRFPTADKLFLAY